MGHSNCDNCGHDTRMCECKEDEMVANQMQVGGDHYSADYQHWDWVADAQVGYFEANATKYLSRWWKKNGVEDLKKAYHYIMKILDLVNDPVRCFVNTNLHVSEYSGDRQFANECFLKFVQSANVPPNEKGIIIAIGCWRTDDDLRAILREIDVLIMDASAGAVPGVPLGGGNPTKGPRTRLNRPAEGRGGGFATRNPEAHNYLDGMKHPFGYDGEG